MSPARQAAQRANGAKGGPKTPEGKQSSSQNAIKTGAYAGPAAILRGRLAEDPDQIAALRAAIIKQRAPQTIEQQLLADEIADQHVTTKRVRTAGEALFKATAQPITHEETEFRRTAREREGSLYDALDFRAWLARRNQDHLWGTDATRWKSVHLQDGRAERFVQLLRTCHETPAWPPSTWWVNQDPEGRNSQEWFLALRFMIIEMFGGSSAHVAAWLDTLITYLKARVYLDDRVGEEYERTRAVRAAAEQLHALERIASVRARIGAETRLDRLNDLYDASDPAGPAGPGDRG